VNWEAIGAVGELVAAAGVIFSLVYLASQIRSQNRESRLTAATEWTNQWNAFSVSFAENPRLSELWVKGCNDFSSLSPSEVIQYSAQCGRFFRVADGVYNQYRQGRLDGRTWQGLARTLEDIAQLPGVKAWWPTRAHWHSDDFRSYVQPFIDSTSPQSMYSHQVIGLTPGEGHADK
jgi:hypothetical protein